MKLLSAVSEFLCSGKRLNQAQEQLLIVLNSLDAIVYVADMDSYEILFVNTYTENIFGDVTGKKCWQSLQANQTGPCPFCTNDKLVDRDGKPTGTYVWQWKNTVNDCWYECRDSAITWFDRRRARLGIATNITERKQFLDKLAKSEERFRMVADYAYDWEYWRDQDGNWQTHAHAMLAGGEVEPLNFRIIAKNGETRWIHHVCRRVFSKDDRNLGERGIQEPDRILYPRPLGSPIQP